MVIQADATPAPTVSVNALPPQPSQQYQPYPPPTATPVAPPNEWVQFTDSLDDSLVEAKEYAAALLTKSDGE